MKKPTFPSVQFNLIADAQAANVSPRALLARARKAYEQARDAAPKKPTAKQSARLALLTEAQRVYAREYRAYMLMQRARLGANRSAQAGNRDRKQAVALQLQVAPAAPRTVLVPAETEADIAKRLNAASAQRQTRHDIAPADPERFAIEAPVDEPKAEVLEALEAAMVLKGLSAETLAGVLSYLLRQLPGDLRSAVAASTRAK